MKQRFFLAQMIAQYVSEWFKTLKFGYHVLHINKYQLLSVDGVAVFYDGKYIGIDECNFKSDTISNEFNSFSNLKSLSE